MLNLDANLILTKDGCSRNFFHNWSITLKTSLTAIYSCSCWSWSRVELWDLSIVCSKNSIQICGQSPLAKTNWSSFESPTYQFQPDKQSYSWTILVSGHMYILRFYFYLWGGQFPSNYSIFPQGMLEFWFISLTERCASNFLCFSQGCFMVHFSPSWKVNIHCLA